MFEGRFKEKVGIQKPTKKEQAYWQMDGNGIWMHQEDRKAQHSQGREVVWGMNC